MRKRGVATIALLVLAGLGLASWASGSGSEAGLIAYSGNNRVYVVAGIGPRPRSIGPGWVVGLSPDGRTAAVLRTAHGGTEHALFLVDTATGAATLLTSSAEASVRWAPDSSQLLAEQFDPKNGISRLLLCSRAAARCHAVARGSFNGFAFSPDGRSIAYGNVQFTGSGTGEVVILTPGGARQVLGAYDTVSLWAPAGLIVSEIPNGQPQTFWLRSGDGAVTRLFSARQGLPFLDAVDVSPDGSRILYESLVSCPLNKPSPTPGACIATGAVIETGSIAGGVPQPASTRLSEAGTAHFAPDGSVIAAFSTDTTRGAPNAYFSPLVYVRAPVYLGEQVLAPAGTAPPPPTLTSDRTTLVAIAR